MVVEGQSWLEALLERADGVDENVRARALATASLLARVRGDHSRALEWNEEALAHYGAVGADEGIAWSLTELATGALVHGRPEEAAPLLEEAEALHRKLGNEGGLRRVLHVEGQQAVDGGDLERGRRLMRESAELSRRHGDIFSEASSLHSLGDIELEAGAVDAAENAYDEGLRAAWDAGLDRLICYGLAGLGAVAAERGDSERAARLWGFVKADEERLQFTLRSRELYERRLSRLVGTAAYDEGRNLDVSEAVEIVLASQRS